MRRLIVAGLVYLTGIAIVVLIKPQFMFREDGRWKEFGIGRDPANFTHFPFWLFAIVWSVLAYVVVVFMEDSLYPRYSTEDVAPIVKNNGRSRNLAPVNSQELVPGYYMLNQGATERNGVPRYVYLGPEEPAE